MRGPRQRAAAGARCMGSFELPMRAPLTFDQRPAATFGANGAPADAPTDARSMWGLHPGPTLAEPRLLMDVIDAANECAHGWLPTEACVDCARASMLVHPAPARTSTLVRPTVPRPLPRWLPAITRRALPAPDPVRPLIAAAAAATPDLIEIFRRAQPVTPVRRKRRKAMPNTPKPVPGGPRPRRTEFVEGLLRQLDDEIARLQHARDAIAGPS